MSATPRDGWAGNVTPFLASGANVSVQTSASGATYVAFSAALCKQLTIVNDTGTDIEFKTNSDSVALPIADGENFTIFGIQSAAEVSVRRVDVSNTQVTVKARWEA
jgi:hypothetical protein